MRTPETDEQKIIGVMADYRDCGLKPPTADDLARVAKRPRFAIMSALGSLMAAKMVEPVAVGGTSSQSRYRLVGGLRK